MRYVLADNAPPPFQHFATFNTGPHVIHKIDVEMALVSAMDMVTAGAFL